MKICVNHSFKSNIAILLLLSLPAIRLLVEALRRVSKVILYWLFLITLTVDIQSIIY